jgi:hypothetical protein
MGILKRERSEWMGILKREGSEWYHQKEISEWVSSKGKEVNGYHQKGRKWMGIIKSGPGEED